MAKSFKKATESAEDIYAKIVKGKEEPNLQQVQIISEKAEPKKLYLKSESGTEDTKNTRATADTKEYYRFNLKMPLEYKDYLQAAAYRESSPTKIVTITEYICKLIADDMERNNG